MTGERWRTWSAGVPPAECAARLGCGWWLRTPDAWTRLAEKLKVTNALPQFIYTDSTGAILKDKGVDPPATTSDDPCATDEVLTGFLRLKLKDVTTEEGIAAAVTAATTAFADACKSKVKTILADITTFTTATSWAMAEEELESREPVGHR